MNAYKFYKSANDWFIDLPEFIEQGGNTGELQMVEGADYMLDIIAAGQDKVLLTISNEPFAEADVLVLQEKCDVTIGGAYYLMEQYQGRILNTRLWLCHVTEFVFDGLPEKIYIRKIN